MVTGDEVGGGLHTILPSVSMEFTCLVEDAQKACGPARTDGMQG